MIDSVAQHQLKTLVECYRSTIEPLEPLSPSQWAERHRKLDPAEAERYGPWRNDVFPFLAPIMDAAEEAMMTGKRGLVVMKAAQGGCSQCVKNIWGWCESYHPGPAGYMISKDELAKKFGRTRFNTMIRTCEPLRRKALLQRGSGTTTQEKVFTDGYLSIFGGRSVLNLQSIPYRYMFIDEVDSLLETLDGSDPIDMARKRTNSYVGETLIVAFGHPSVKGHGSGKLYYTESDQRRGYVTCRKCDKDFWLNWEYVELVVPAGSTEDVAKLHAENYQLRCPHCKVNVTDADRITMLRTLTYRSELTPEEQKNRTWIGLHFSELYYPHKTLQAIVEDKIACREDDIKLRTFYNKSLGEPYEATLKQFTPAIWQRCVVYPTGPEETSETTEAYRRGEVPRNVTCITAGQDSHRRELYWSIWGWAKQLCKDGHRYLRGWMLDYGVHLRDATGSADMDMLTVKDLAVFDQTLFDRVLTTKDGDALRVSLAGMDSGWQPTAIYQYCQRWPGRAVPTKGSSERGLDYQNTTKIVQWGQAMTHSFNGEVISAKIRPALLNTFQLKLDFFNFASKRLEIADRQVPVLSFPMDSSEGLFKQLSAERLCTEEIRGKDTLVWRQSGQNHWLDTSIYAYACALNLEPIMRVSDERLVGEPAVTGYVPDGYSEGSLYRL